MENLKDKRKHLINYYQVSDNIDKYYDYCLSHNIDQRVTKLLQKVDNKDILYNSTKYPFDLYKDFEALIKDHFMANSIILGSGSEDFISRINNFYLKDKSIGVVVPNFYRIYETAKDVKYVYLKNNTSETIIDISVIEKQINENKLDAVWVSNPNSIIGKGYNRESLLYLIRKYENVLFLVDEANIDFADKKVDLELINHVSKHKNLVVLRSFSKYFGIPGIRIGIIITENRDLNNYFRNNSCVFPVASPSVAIASLVLKNIDFFDSLVEEIHQNRNKLTDLIKGKKKIKVSQSITNTICLSSDNIDIWNVLKSKNIYTLNLKNEIGVSEKNAVRVTIHSCDMLFNNLYSKIQQIDM